MEQPSEPAHYRGAGEFPTDDHRHDEHRAHGHSPADQLRSARPRVLADLSLENERAGEGASERTRRECVGRAWSRWPWNALTFTVSAARRGSRRTRGERKRGAADHRRCTHTKHASPLGPSATHSATLHRRLHSVGATHQIALFRASAPRHFG